MELEVLYCDDCCVAINKPPGLLVHRTPIAADVPENAVDLLNRQLGRRVFAVHRLDRPTSGVLLFAFDSESANRLTTEFARRNVIKQYLAVARGHLDETGVIDKALKPVYVPEDGDQDSDVADDAAQSQTEYRTLAHCEIPVSAGKYPTSRYSLVLARPVTGRSHQIRRHFDHIHHPIIGDGRYGDHRHNKLFREHFGIQRLLLVAHRLRIRHPRTGALLDLRSTPGAEFDRALHQLGLNSVLYLRNTEVLLDL